MLQRKFALRIGLAWLCVMNASCAQSPDRPESGVASSHEAQVAKFLYHLQDDMPVTSVVWSPDGRYIAASSTMGNKLHIWDVEKRHKLPELELASANSGFGELSWDRRAGLAVCNGDHGKVKLIEENTWRVTRILSSESDTRCIAGAFSSDGAQFAVLGFYLSVYDTKSWQLIRSLNVVKDISGGIPFAIEALAYVPGTHTILLGGSEWEGSKPPRSPLGGHVFVLNPEDDVPSRKFSAYTLNQHSQGPGVTRLVVSPDGKEVATGTETGSGISGLNLVTTSVHIFNLSDGSLLGAPLDDRGFGRPEALSYTPDGRYLLVAHGGIHVEHLVHILDTQSLQIVDTVGAENTIYSEAVRQDSSQFAVSAGSGIDVWSLRRDL